jgi:hypothetical protein
MEFKNDDFLEGEELGDWIGDGIDRFGDEGKSS